MSDDYAFQVSEKAGDAIVVVRAGNYAEFAENLALIAEAEAIELISNFTVAVKALAPVKVLKAAAPGSTVVEHTDSGNVNTGVSKPGYAPDDEFASVTCSHGERTWFSSPKGWKAWFCPSKDANDKCPPEFVQKKK